MAVTKVIRYKTHPESADENERLIRDVFAELAEQQPPGLQYAAFRLDDGVSFLHVAVIDGATNPLSASSAFGKFQAGIHDRCVEGPAASDAAIVGSYQFLRLFCVSGGLACPAVATDASEISLVMLGVRHRELDDDAR
jgi:hypothetical protein